LFFRKLFKWTVFILFVYVAYGMLTAPSAPERVSADDFVDRLLRNSAPVKGSHGEDLIQARIADNTLDTWLSNNLIRAGALTLKAREKTEDSTAVRRSLKYFDAAALVDSSRGETYHFLSFAQEELGDRDAAIASCERSVALLNSTDTTNVLAWLGKLYYDRGDTVLALEAFHKQLQRDPKNEWYYSDTRFYIGLCSLPPEKVEQVLRESRIHTNWLRRLERAYASFVAWPKRSIYHYFGKA
jgi:tetratricopeptide (TPR) repeat protein